MNKYIYKLAVLLAVVLLSCDNANDLLDGYIKDGPVIYAGKINELETQSGYYRYRVNIYPAADVNRDYCILSWSINNGVKDSVIVDYTEQNFDKKLGCYYQIIELPNVEGNLFVEAQNVDVFGNKSLITDKGAFLYGATYVSTLLNSSVGFSSGANTVIFESRVGSVGNLVSYEQTNGQFTKEVFVETDAYPLVNAKRGGTLRSKTRYLITATDIDTLVTSEYLETRIP